MNLMNIYEIQWQRQGEREWVAAHTTVEAIKVYCSATDMDLTDFDDEDEIVMIPREKWSGMVIYNADYDKADPDDLKYKTFEQWMAENSRPDIIAGTTYYE